MKQKGFSLIELLVVIAIIGIVSALGYPSFDKYKKKKEVDVGAQKLLQHLRTVHRKAVSNKWRYQVTVNKVIDRKTKVVTKYQKNSPCTLTPNFKQTEEDKIELKRVNVTVNGLDRAQEFCQDGKCDSSDTGSSFDGEYKLQHILGQKYGQYKITISKATCFIKLEKWVNEKWEETS